jgi:2-polyprenyl-3-methyl-5-hydroxy-6-metoxy-1,4-benzoquinol methylase
MPNYGDPKYWEDRYKTQTETTFDWLEDYDTLKALIDELNICKDDSKTIVLGCGNAEFSEDMYSDGYSDIYNIDISESVIQLMQERNKEKTMKCK